MRKNGSMKNRYNESFSQMESGNANSTRWEVLCEDMRIFETVNKEVASWCSCSEVEKEITENELKNFENMKID